MKTGGSVSKAVASYEKRERKSEEKADIKQDKAVVKKAIAMHDKQEHPGEKTDLSKLKKGGRSKKATGTVRKFEKASGQYGAKKTAEDKKNIAEAKRFKKGGKVKKYEEGGSILDKGIEAVKSFGRDIKNNILGTPEQNRIAQESMDKQARAGSKLAKFFGGNAESAAEKKCKGGRMTKKYASGGSIDDDVRARAMKWIESGSPEQAEAPSAPVKPSKPKAAAKSQPETDREEYSPWMREFRKQEATEAENKRESESLAAKYPEKRTPSKMIRDEAEIAQRPSLETKGLRLMKGYGMKRGGKACK